MLSVHVGRRDAALRGERRGGGEFDASSFATSLAHLQLICAQDMFDAQITNICLGVQSIVEKVEARGIQLP
jgi:hypothetical protein